MFKSIRYKDYHNLTSEHSYELEDSEFGTVSVRVSTSFRTLEAMIVSIVKEYSSRNLNVAKNLAIFTIWFSENLSQKVETICEYQDKRLHAFLPNWKEYAIARDEYIKHILLLG